MDTYDSAPSSSLTSLGAIRAPKGVPKVIWLGGILLVPTRPSIRSPISAVISELLRLSQSENPCTGVAQVFTDGDLQAAADTTKLARFVQTVQSGMAIRARDGADRAELQNVAEIALAGWDQIMTNIDHRSQRKGTIYD